MLRLHLFSHVNSVLFKTSTSNVKKLQRAQTMLARIYPLDISSFIYFILFNFSQISGPVQLHLYYFAYTGYRLSRASNTNWQLFPINHCQ